VNDRKFLLILIGSATLTLAAITAGILFFAKKPPVRASVTPVPAATAVTPTPKQIPTITEAQKPESLPKPQAIVVPPKPVAVAPPEDRLGVSRKQLVDTLSTLHLYDGQVISSAPIDIDPGQVAWKKPLHALLWVNGDPANAKSATLVYVHCGSDCGEYEKRLEHTTYGLVAMKRLIELLVPKEHETVNKWVASTVGKLKDNEEREIEAEGKRIALHFQPAPFSAWWLSVSPKSVAATQDYQDDKEIGFKERSTVR
jgi:hypothetical protein